MASPDPAGFEPTLLALPSLTPALALELLPKGVTLHRLFVQADGRTHDVLLGPEQPTDHAQMRYTNCIIGRYTNRIVTDTHKLGSSRHPSLQSSLTPSPNGPDANQRVSLHGGPHGWDERVWKSVTPQESTLFTPAEAKTISSLPAAQILQLVSEDGDAGYPGSVLCETLVALVDGWKDPSSPRVSAPEEMRLGSVVLVYRARLLDGQTTVTPINLTQHWGFNLDASLRTSASSAPKDAKAHVLKIDSDATIALDADCNSAGELAPSKGTPYDFMAGKALGDGWPDAGGAAAGGAGGYDEFYMFRKGRTPPQIVLSASDLGPSADLVKDVVSPDGPGGSPVVELNGAESGLRLAFHTNQSGVQLYTANFYDPMITGQKKIHGGSGGFGAGQGYEKGAGVFLEFHEPLAAFLHPDTVRSGYDTLLGPGEVYNNWVRMDVLNRNGSKLAHE